MSNKNAILALRRPKPKQGLLGLRIFKLRALLQVQQYVAEHKSLSYRNPTQPTKQSMAIVFPHGNFLKNKNLWILEIFATSSISKAYSRFLFFFFFFIFPSLFPFSFSIQFFNVPLICYFFVKSLKHIFHFQFISNFFW